MKITYTEASNVENPNDWVESQRMIKAIEITLHANEP